MMEAQRGCGNIELVSSLTDIMSVGRPENFSREVWKHGFADTRLQNLGMSHTRKQVSAVYRVTTQEDLVAQYPPRSALKRPILGPANNLHRQASSLLQ
jgi:hypothetical protein